MLCWNGPRGSNNFIAIHHPAYRLILTLTEQRWILQHLTFLLMVCRTQGTICQYFSSLTGWSQVVAKYPTIVPYGPQLSTFLTSSEHKSAGTSRIYEEAQNWLIKLQVSISLQYCSKYSIYDARLIVMNWNEDCLGRKLHCRLQVREFSQQVRTLYFWPPSPCSDLLLKCRRSEPNCRHLTLIL